MTPSPLIPVLLPLLDDLARDMPQDERYSRLLQALQQLMPCDAIALLRLEDEQLVPLAVRGLSAELAQKLAQVRPLTVGQAQRIPGMTPAAISLLLVHLERARRTRAA